MDAIIILVLAILLIDGSTPYSIAKLNNFDMLLERNEASQKSAGGFMKYPICLTNSDCALPWGRCISPICLQACKSVCSNHEFCYEKFDVCVPKLIRRRYTKRCDQESHCFLNEFCHQGQCESKDDKPPCEFRGQCKANETCISGYCVKQKKPCAGNNCPKFEDRCNLDSDCEGNNVCVQSKCLTPVPVSCSSSTDCQTDESCLFGACKTQQCAENSDCNDEEECLHRRCLSIKHIILNKICEGNDQCFEGEECKNQKCIPEMKVHTVPVNHDKVIPTLTNQNTVLPTSTNEKTKIQTKKVLPKNFICSCKEKEDCDMSDCSSELINATKTEVINSTTFKSLKAIIKDLLKKEERNLVFEISKRKRITEDKAIKMYQRKLNDEKRRSKKDRLKVGETRHDSLNVAERGHDDLNVVGEFLPSATPNRGSIITTDSFALPNAFGDVVEVGENCVNDKNCADKKCCILGVCVEADDCELIQRNDDHTIYEMMGTGVTCSSDVDCIGNRFACHLGHCIYSAKENTARETDDSECSNTAPCTSAKRTCLFGVCVETIIVDDIVPCIHGGAQCEDENRVCWMRSCVLLD